MPESTPRVIRVSIKALIVARGSVLTIRKREQLDEYYVLPGGGQHPGESVSDAVIRECFEELGIKVRPIDVVLIRDYIGKHHEFADKHAGIHQLEIVFRCSITGDLVEPIPGGHKPDPGQIGIEWIPLDRITEVPLYPLAIRQPVIDLLNQNQQAKSTGSEPGDWRVYLGDVN